VRKRAQTHLTFRQGNRSPTVTTTTTGSHCTRTSPYWRQPTRVPMAADLLDPIERFAYRHSPLYTRASRSILMIDCCRVRKLVNFAELYLRIVTTKSLDRETQKGVGAPICATTTTKAFVPSASLLVLPYQQLAYLGYIQNPGTSGTENGVSHGQGRISGGDGRLRAIG
jgi:hypothetical protein